MENKIKTKGKPFTKNFVKKSLVVLALAGFGYTAEWLSTTKVKEPANDSLEIKEIYGIAPFSAPNGLYLNVQEKDKTSGRIIHFFDYGFDGKLDYIKIDQPSKKSKEIEDPVELAKWQTIFESLRDRRFGKYESRRIYE